MFVGSFLGLGGRGALGYGNTKCCGAEKVSVENCIIIGSAYTDFKVDMSLDTELNYCTNAVSSHSSYHRPCQLIALCTKDTYDKIRI